MHTGPLSPRPVLKIFYMTDLFPWCTEKQTETSHTEDDILYTSQHTVIVHAAVLMCMQGHSKC